MTFSFSRARALGVGLACATAGVIALVAISDQAGAVAPNAKDHFGVLAKPTAAGDARFFSSAPATQMAALNADTAPDPAAARTRVTPVTGAFGTRREISVTSGRNGHVCLGHRTSPAGPGAVFINCAPTDAAAKYGLVSITRPAPGDGIDAADTDVTALLPDGVNSVGFTLSDGTRQTASVTDNTVAAHLQAPASMSFTDDTGARTVNLRGQ